MEFVEVGMRTSPFVLDNAQMNRRRLCTIDYTPSEFYTPDDLWVQIRLHCLDGYDVVRDRMGCLYWM